MDSRVVFLACQARSTLCQLQAHPHRGPAFQLSCLLTPDGSVSQIHRPRGLRILPFDEDRGGQLTLISIEIHFQDDQILQSGARFLGRRSTLIHPTKSSQCTEDLLSVFSTFSPLPYLSTQALITVDASCRRAAFDVTPTRLNTSRSWHPHRPMLPLVTNLSGGWTRI